MYFKFFNSGFPRGTIESLSMMELFWLESDISEPSFFEFESGAVLGEEFGKEEIMLVEADSVVLEQASSVFTVLAFLKESSMHLASCEFISLIMIDYFYDNIYSV